MLFLVGMYPGAQFIAARLQVEFKAYIPVSMLLISKRNKKSHLFAQEHDVRSDEQWSKIHFSYYVIPSNGRQHVWPKNGEQLYLKWVNKVLLLLLGSSSCVGGDTAITEPRYPPTCACSSLEEVDAISQAFP